jgi:hypothetical protein
MLTGLGCLPMDCENIEFFPQLNNYKLIRNTLYHGISNVESEISGSHGDKYKYDCFLEWCIMWSAGR